MNCTTHNDRPAVAVCDHCGKPICERCYNDFHIKNEDDEHLCYDCFKRVLNEEIGEVRELKGMITKEFVFIIIGIIVGLFLGLDIYFGFGIITSKPTHAIIAPIFLPFIFGSLLTIIKRIKNSYMEVRDTSGDDTSTGFNIAMIIFTIAINLAIAPIVTTIRFFQRLGDMKKLNRIATTDEDLLLAIEEYIAKSLRPSGVAASSEGNASDVEISLDAILASNLGSDAALCDNGEILRNVRER